MIGFNQEELDKASEMLRAVSHNLRLSIISLLDEKGEVNVNVIYTTLKLEQSITSQHLKILRDNDIVHTKRDGKMIFYTLNYDRLKIINDAIMKFDTLTRERLKNKKKTSQAN